MPVRSELHELNRLSWNAATVAHNSHKSDQAAFFRNGGSTLFPEELQLLGNVRGKRLAHLLCNSGQDSLSLAKEGAVVMGIDISDEAIAFAERLSAESKIHARFQRADVYAWLASAREIFDVAFCSYGALCWLSDLDAFADGLFTRLAPNGRFVCMEFHPVGYLFNPQLARVYPYFAEGRAEVGPNGVNDYVGDSGDALAPSGFAAGVSGFANPHPEHLWMWGIGEVVTALLAAGFKIERLTEWPYANGCRLFERMERDEARRWHLPAGEPSLPLMYGVVARR